MTKTTTTKATTLPALDGLLVIEAHNDALNIDPDVGVPRTNPISGKGEVSAECIKAKIRRSAMRLNPTLVPFYHRGAVHQDHIEQAYEAAGAIVKTAKKASKKTAKAEAPDIEDTEAPDTEDAEDNTITIDTIKGNAELCRIFFDVSWFGLVVTKPGRGQIRGPFSFGIGETVYPVNLDERLLTRQTVTNRERSDKQKGANQEFGRKTVVTHGVYLVHWHFDPFCADQNGLTEQDLAEFIEAMLHMFRNDQSSARNNVTLRKAYVFEHASPFRDAEPVELLEQIKVTAENPDTAVSWDAYTVEVPADLPETIKLHVLKDGLTINNPWVKASAAE